MPVFGAPAFVLPTGSNTAHVDFNTGGTVNNVSGIPFVSGVSTLLRMNNATDTTLTGVSGGVDGAILTIVRLGAGNVNFSHQSASSAAANQFFNVVTSGATSISTGGTATYVYDSASQRWRLTAHTQGAWISIGTLTASGNGAMTFTGFTAGGTYCLSGKTMSWQFDMSGTVGGVPNTAISITLPNAMTTGPSNVFTIYEDISHNRSSMSQCSGSSTTMTFYADFTAGTAWAAGAERMVGIVVLEMT